MQFPIFCSPAGGLYRITVLHLAARPFHSFIICWSDHNGRPGSACVVSYWSYRCLLPYARRPCGTRRRADKARTGRRMRKETANGRPEASLGVESDRTLRLRLGPAANSCYVRLYRFLVRCFCTCVLPSARFLYRPDVLPRVVLSVRLRVHPSVRSSVCPADWPLGRPAVRAVRAVCSAVSRCPSPNWPRTYEAFDLLHDVSTARPSLTGLGEGLGISIFMTVRSRMENACFKRKNTVFRFLCF